MKTVAGDGKKREILGLPPFGPQASGPTFSRFGPPPFGAPSLMVQKFNIPKLAEVDIGRSRASSGGWGPAGWGPELWGA